MTTALRPTVPATPAFPRDDWETPPDLFASYDRLFRFTVDAAANHRNALCPKYWDRETDGLLQRWSRERVWCHPPHTEPGPWVVKARASAQLGAISVLLVPAQTDSEWWHNAVIPFAAVRFLRGRVPFRLQRIPITDSSARLGPQVPFAIVVFKPGTK